MRNPITVFVDGVQGKLLASADERFLYFFEWKVLFTVIAAIVLLLVDVLIFHAPLGGAPLWLAITVWVVLLVLDSIKKYDRIYHKESVILDQLIAQVRQYAQQAGIPLPPEETLDPYQNTDADKTLPQSGPPSGP